MSMPAAVRAVYVMRSGAAAESRAGIAAIGLGFAAGVGGYFLAAEPPPDLAVLAILLLALLLAIVGRSVQWIRWPLAALALGFCWSHLWACALLCQPFPDAMAQQDLTLVGRIASLPDVTAERTRFLFDVESLTDSGSPIQFRGRVRLSWYQDAPPLQAGERWRFRVRLKPPHGFVNPGGFDYERWLFRQQVKATGYVRTQVAPQRLNAGAGAYWLTRWRQQLRERLQQGLPSGVGAALIPALVIGDRGALTPAQWAVFSRTGTSHLIAISGLHVGLVSAAVFWLTRRGWARMPGLTLRLAAPRAAAVAALFAALVYAALAGFSVSTQRAVAMLAVVLIAILAGRTLRASSALVLALAVVLLIDPAAVLDYGFWLSFGAVAVLLYALGWRLGPPGWIARWGAAQWAVALGLLPLLIAFFGRASLIAPLVNLLAVPLFGLLLPLILVASLAFLLSGWLLPLLVVDWLLRQGYQLLANAADLPWASLTLGGRPDWVWGVAGLGALLLLAPRGLPGRWMGAILLLPLWLMRPPSPAPGELQVTLLDVGQGLAAVMRTQRHTLVYDTGPRFRSGFNTGEAVVAPYLQHLGIGSIDLLVISHADQDHAGGLQGLLRSVTARRILTGEPDRIKASIAAALKDKAAEPLTGGPQKHRSNALEHEIQTLTIERCQRGQHWHWDGVDFEILHPPDAAETGNNSSCVLRVSIGETALLWPGDVEASVEQQLQQRDAAALQSAVLVAGHHGSASSTSEGFLRAVSPQLVLFSMGWKNRYDFPAASVRERVMSAGALSLDTASTGAIQLQLDRPAGLRITGLYRQQADRLWRHHPPPAVASELVPDESIRSMPAQGERQSDRP